MRHKVSPLRELPKAFRQVLHAMCPTVKHRSTHMSNLAMAMSLDQAQGRLRLLEDKGVITVNPSTGRATINPERLVLRPPEVTPREATPAQGHQG